MRRRSLINIMSAGTPYITRPGIAYMDSGFLSYVVVADPDSSQLSDRSAGPAIEPRRDAG